MDLDLITRRTIIFETTVDGNPNKHGFKDKINELQGMSEKKCFQFPKIQLATKTEPQTD